MIHTLAMMNKSYTKTYFSHEYIAISSDIAYSDTGEVLDTRKAKHVEEKRTRTLAKLINIFGTEKNFARIVRVYNFLQIV